MVFLCNVESYIFGARNFQLDSIIYGDFESLLSGHKIIANFEKPKMLLQEASTQGKTNIQYFGMQIFNVFNVLLWFFFIWKRQIWKEILSAFVCTFLPILFPVLLLFDPVSLSLLFWLLSRARDFLFLLLLWGLFFPVVIDATELNSNIWTVIKTVESVAIFNVQAI